MTDLLHPERHKHCQRFRCQRSADTQLRCAVRQNRIQPLKLLPAEDIQRTQVLSRTLPDGFGIRVKLLLGICRMHQRNERRNHALIAGYQIIEKFTALLTLTLHVIRNGSGKVIVAVLLSLPIGNVGFHRKQLILTQFHGGLCCNGACIDRKDHTSVDVGQLRNETVLDKVGIVTQIQYPAVSPVHFEIVGTEFQTVRCNGILEAVSALCIQPRVIVVIVLRAVVEEVKQGAELLFRCDLLKFRTELCEQRRKFGRDTVEIRPRFFLRFLFHRNRQVLVLCNAV